MFLLPVRLPHRNEHLLQWDVRSNHWFGSQWFEDPGWSLDKKHWDQGNLVDLWGFPAGVDHFMVTFFELTQEGPRWAPGSTPYPEFRVNKK